VLDEIRKIAQRFARQISSKHAAVIAERPWGIVDDDVKRRGVDVFLHVAGVDADATKRLLEYVRREIGPDRLTDPFFKTLRAVIAAGLMTAELREHLEQQNRANQMS
jgi:hypothetical protein